MNAAILAELDRIDAASAAVRALLQAPEPLAEPVPAKVGLTDAAAFFNAVRGQCVTSLYDNDMAYALFGYPGSAWEKGGYITRGFQDLKWLPNPSQEASPPPFMG